MFKITETELTALYLRWTNSQNPLRFGQFLCNRFNLDDEDIFYEDTSHGAFKIVLNRYGVREEILEMEEVLYGS